MSVSLERWKTRLTSRLDLRATALSIERAHLRLRLARVTKAHHANLQMLKAAQKRAERHAQRAFELGMANSRLHGRLAAAHLLVSKMRGELARAHYRPTIEPASADRIKRETDTLRQAEKALVAMADELKRTAAEADRFRAERDDARATLALHGHALPPTMHAQENG